ncbi:uncharacterized protein LOC132714475 [Ruditapes philippinarum]|uniref:uncharacterized protein LOC132714475 n=1 Tax=Ruditapes philippinarum TaxID=129788 RepID=UPI00295B92D7|nr:uncharacterized protein LOC132714475 [Ruditapes philippinarum]
MGGATSKDLKKVGVELNNLKEKYEMQKQYISEYASKVDNNLELLKKRTEDFDNRANKLLDLFEAKSLDIKCLEDSIAQQKNFSQARFIELEQEIQLWNRKVDTTMAQTEMLLTVSQDRERHMEKLEKLTTKLVYTQATNAGVDINEEPIRE